MGPWKAEARLFSLAHHARWPIWPPLGLWVGWLLLGRAVLWLAAGMAETPTRALACAAPGLLVIATGIVALWPVIDLMCLPAPVLLIGPEGL